MLKKLIHILLASVLLISSTGFVTDKHYCLDNLVSATIFIDAEMCHDAPLEEIPDAPERNNKPQLTKKSCCDDVLTLFELEPQNQTASANDFSIYTGIPSCQMLLNPVLTTTIFEILPRYKPPLLCWNLPIRFQQFRC